MKGIIFLGLFSVAFGLLKTPGGSCPPNESGTPTYLPDLCNCTQYYECSSGTPILTSCSPGLEWNNQKKTCDWPKNANCNTDKCPNSRFQPKTQCPAEDDPEHDVLFPVPGDCHSFYKCFQGNPVKIPCPEGLLWNQNKLQCDWPSEVDCKP